MEVPMDVAPPTHHSKRAIRGWRILLDKLGMLLVFASLQQIVDEWFPPSQHSPGSHLEHKEETLEDVYAAIIADAKMLPPLKSKEVAKTPISNCVHPKERLKGGGNASSSYIVCRDCLARWPNHLPAAEIKKQLKENKELAKKGGLLSQPPQDAEMESMAGWETQFQALHPAMQSMGQQQAQIQQLQRMLLEEQKRNHEMHEYILHSQMMRQGATSAAPPATPSLSAVDLVAEALINNQDYDPAIHGVPVMKASAKTRSAPHMTEDVIEVESDGYL